MSREDGIATKEMVATFCNVATGPNNAGYGTHGGAIERASLREEALD
jgi:hypothetical protein